MPRPDGRTPQELRPIRIEPGAQVHAEGSVMISFGITRVLCAVSVEERVPRFLRGRGVGWVTTEYAMLPRSTHTRTARERGSGGGRTQEIQRLIGRSLRAVVNLDLLGERTFTVDCDVIQADGGTRTAAITGGYVALYLAFQRLVQEGRLSSVPLRAALAATSVGQLGDEIIVDLCYEEDSVADVDMNVVKTSAGDYVEVQGTAEGRPFPRPLLEQMLNAADGAVESLFAAQRTAICEATGADPVV